MSDCPICAEFLVDYLYDQLDNGDRRTFDGHLRLSAPCAATAASLAATELATRTAHPPEPSPAILASLKAEARTYAAERRVTLKAERARPATGGRPGRAATWWDGLRRSLTFGPALAAVTAALAVAVVSGWLLLRATGPVSMLADAEPRQREIPAAAARRPESLTQRTESLGDSQAPVRGPAATPVPSAPALPKGDFEAAPPEDQERGLAAPAAEAPHEFKDQPASAAAGLDRPAGNAPAKVVANGSESSSGQLGENVISIADAAPVTPATTDHLASADVVAADRPAAPMLAYDAAAKLERGRRTASEADDTRSLTADTDRASPVAAAAPPADDPGVDAILGRLAAGDLEGAWSAYGRIASPDASSPPTDRATSGAKPSAVAARAAKGFAGRADASSSDELFERLLSTVPATNPVARTATLGFLLRLGQQAEVGVATRALTAAVDLALELDRPGDADRAVTLLDRRGASAAAAAARRALERRASERPASGGGP